MEFFQLNISRGGMKNQRIIYGIRYAIYAEEA